MKCDSTQFRVLARLGAFLAALRRNRRGNVIVIFGLTLPIVIVILGMGIDYFAGLSFKARWDMSADAASLAAVKAAEAYAEANATQSAATLSAGAIAAGEAQGVKVFAANAGSSEATETVTPTVTVTESGPKFSATVSYSGVVTAHFGGLVGLSMLALSGSASASATMTTYINYYIIVDTSESMGVGASLADMQTLYARTQLYGNGSDGEPGCVLACHVTTATNSGAQQTYSNEYLAHQVSPTVTLRIDAAKTAIQSVIAQAQAAGSLGNIQIGLYTMSSSSNGLANPTIGPYVDTVSAPTSDFATLSSLASAIDLAAPDSSHGFGNSDFPDSLSSFNSGVLSTASLGNGFSRSTPLNYVLIVTDGLQDVYGNCVYGHCTQAFDASLCASLKAKATVGVIYTTYLPLYQNNNPADGYDSLYVAMVQPYATQISANLQSCATSSQYYFEATDGAALQAAMASLFASTMQALRLTQ